MTLSPCLKAGVVTWEDSPLLRAVKHGRCLVVDEADKAPLEVVCVLKARAEIITGKKLPRLRQYGNMEEP